MVIAQYQSDRIGKLPLARVDMNRGIEKVLASGYIIEVRQGNVAVRPADEGRVEFLGPDSAQRGPKQGFRIQA